MVGRPPEPEPEPARPELARPELRSGCVAPELRAEFPGLRLRWLTVPGGRGSRAAELRARLRGLSDRYRGAGVISMRLGPVAHAFRAFYRQVGLDPDVQRIPSEQAAVTRLLHGQFRAADAVADACLVALLEVGVPVWALDADAVAPGGPGIRLAGSEDAPREALRDARGGAAAAGVPSGSLVVADARRVHAELFQAPRAAAAGPRTARVLLYAIAVDGVPEIHLEEALWTAAELLGAPEADC